MTSDPIGLDGGLNTYVYAENSPLNMIDMYGLNVFAGSWANNGAARGPFGPVCGSGRNASFIPDGIYRQACANHDRCYETCGKSKLDCDYALVMDGAPIYTLFLLFSDDAEEAYNNAQDEAGCNDGSCND